MSPAANGHAADQAFLRALSAEAGGRVAHARPLSAPHVASPAQIPAPARAPVAPAVVRPAGPAAPSRAPIITSTPRAAAAPPPAPQPAAAPIPLRDGDVLLGRADEGGPVGLSLAKLIEGRMLIQGSSGAGKSWTLRRLLERTAGLIQQIVIDPEGEFRSFAEARGLVVLDHQLDRAALMVAAERVREHRVSVLLDLSDLDREGQMSAAAAFISALVGAPREFWTPVLVAIDEAHLLAPYGVTNAAPSIRKASIDAVTDLMSRGRKRGLCGVMATQRIVRLSKGVISEAQNFLIGLNTLDLDIRRAAETIGWDPKRAFQRLPSLPAGSFVSVGPAFSRETVVQVGPVETRHRGETPSLPKGGLAPPANPEALLGLSALIGRSSADAASLDAAQFTPGLRAVRALLREAAFPLAARCWEALRGLAPEGARVAELGPFLGASAGDVAEALALLDRYGVLDFEGAGEARAVRLSRGALL